MKKSRTNEDIRNLETAIADIEEMKGNLLHARARLAVSRDQSNGTETVSSAAFRATAQLAIEHMDNHARFLELAKAGVEIAKTERAISSKRAGDAFSYGCITGSLIVWAWWALSAVFA